MHFEAVYEVSTPDVVAEDFGGEVVVLNLANGRYFSLLGVSADIWRDLARGHKPRDLIDYAAAARASLGEAVAALISGLISEGLVRPLTDSEGRASPMEAASAAAALLACEEVPPMESFDDMAELILADPIHDVDEDIGWPVKRDPAPTA